jgi:hypothetical protein
MTTSFFNFTKYRGAELEAGSDGSMLDRRRDDFSWKHCSAADLYLPSADRIERSFYQASALLDLCPSHSGKMVEQRSNY